MMDRICARVEKDQLYRTIINADHPDARHNDAGDAITIAADQVAHNLQAACNVTYTTSGTTCLRAVRQRPAMKVVCSHAEPLYSTALVRVVRGSCFGYRRDQ